MQYSYKLFKFHGTTIKIHILFILLFVAAPIVFFLLFNLITSLAILQFLLLLTLSVLLHEFAIAYIAKRYKVYFSEILLLPFGGISVRTTLSEKSSDEAKIAAYGLMVYSIIVLLMVPFIYIFYGVEGPLRTRIYDFSPIINFFQINFALMIFNLIPLYPLDSGRILRSFIVDKYGNVKATKVVKWLTFALVIVIIFVGLILGAFLIVLLLFLYVSAHGKGKFDEAAGLLEIKDRKARRRERSDYLKTRKRVLKHTKKIRERTEDILGRIPIGIVPKLWIKFRDYFDTKLAKGKFNLVREKLISILPLILHIRNLIKLWLKTYQVRKTILFLAIASICLTLVWVFPIEFMIVLSVGFILCFGISSLIIFYETRSRKLVIFTILGIFFWIIYLGLDQIELLLKLDYWSYLYLEGFRGFMVPLTGIMFFAAIINSNDFFMKARASMPIPAFLIVFTLYFIGTFVLLYEIYLISAFETDLDSIRFILRYDIAYLIWFIASLTILGSLIYLSYIGSISHYGRLTTVKITAATIVAIFLLSFFTRDLFILMICRLTTPPEDIDLKVGLHSSNVTMLDESEFDNFFHLEVTWSKVYSNGPEPDLADWEDTDWQLRYALDHGIDIFFLIHPYPPKWFVDEHKDSIMRDQWNETFAFIDQDPGRHSGSRIWDLSFNDPAVVNEKINFTLEAVERYQNLTCIKYISIQNEPAYPVDFNHNRIASYDKVTIDAYRDWLKDLYDNDLDKFRNKTGVNVKSWSKIKAPRGVSDRLWNSWREFREESLINFVKELTTSVKQKTTKPVTVKLMGHFLARYQIIQTGLSDRVMREFIKVSDVVSIDLYPLTVADLINSLDYYKKLANGKSIIISEFNMVLGSNLPGSGSMFYYELIIINRYADAVIIYTGDDHYIYGINLYDHTPIHLGLKLFKIHRSGGDVFSLYGELLWENMQSIPNYYEIYVYACTVWNLPIIPWPILLLIVLPVPIADDARRWRVKKYMYTIILLLLILFFITSNFL